MFKKTLFILVCVVALPFLLSPKINLSNSAATSTYPQIVVDNANNIHVVWLEKGGGSRFAVYYIWYNGQSWSTPIKISKGTAVENTVSIRQLAIDHDASFRIYVAWNEGGTVKLRIKNGSTWGGETVVASGNLRNGTIRLSVRSQGNLAVIWWNTAGTHARVMVNGRWESVKEVNSSSNRAKHPDIHFGANRIYAVWVRKSGVYSTMYSYRGVGYNSGWSSERKVSSDNHEHEFPRVTIRGDGVQHAFFLTWHGGPKLANVSRGSGNGFASPTEVSGLATHHFPILYHRGNVLYAAWQQGGYNAGQGIFYTVNSGGRWSSVEKTPDSKGAKAGDIATSTDNKTNYVVWDAYGEVYLHTSSGVEAPAPLPNKPPRARFSYHPYEGLYPLDVNFDGRASSDSDGKIVSYKWKFGDGTSGSGKTIGHTYTKKGTYEVELTVTDNDGDSGRNNALVKVVAIQPPVGVKYEILENRSLFFIEYVYKVTWNKNPINLEWGSNVVEYKIYRKKTGDVTYSYFATVKAEDNNEYFDRTLGTTLIQYQYAIKGVDSMGRESDLDAEYYHGPENTTRIKKKTAITK